MFSMKELAVFSASIGFGLAYMAFKLSYEIAKTAANQDIVAVRDFLLRYQIFVFFLYVLLILAQLLMIYVARRFVKNPVKENFENTGWITVAAGTLWLFAAVSFIMAMFDGLHFLAMWVMRPLEAIKFSCFFYWVYRIYNNPIPELSQIAVLWQIPMLLIEVFLGLHAHHKYYDAKKLFSGLYPNIVRTGIYNAFSSRSKNGNRLHIKAPEDIAEPAKEQNDDGISPLRKSLGSNSMYSVNPPPKEKTIIKTQSEIDEEYEAFFSDSPVTAAKANTVSPSPQPTGEDCEQELIPTEFDFSKMKLSAYNKVNTDGESENAEEKIACPLCGYLNTEGSGECEFCGALLK